MATLRKVGTNRRRNANLRAKEARRRKRKGANRSIDSGPKKQRLTVRVEHDGKGTEAVFEPLPGTTLFSDVATDEPGTHFECPECGSTYYVEGIVGTSHGHGSIEHAAMSLVNGCPDCGATMQAAVMLVNTAHGAVAASHPMALEFLLRALLADLESGAIQADAAVDQLRSRPLLNPLVQWIEDRGSTANIVAAVLIATLAFIGGRTSGSDGSLTPEEVEQIVRIVDAEHDTQQPTNVEPEAQSTPTLKPQPAVDHPSAPEPPSAGQSREH